MSVDGNANLIAGRWGDSLAAGRFDSSAALAPRTALGSWPCSGPEDVALALEGAASGARGWSELAPSRRRARLLDAARRLEEDARALALAADRIGLREQELAQHVRLVRPLAERLELGAARGSVGPGGWVSVCAPDWSELFLGLLGGVADELSRGHACVLVADPELPMVADAVARALLAAGVAEDAVCVLHGLTPEGLAALVVDARVRALTASGGSERISRLRSLCQEGRVESERLVLLRCSAVEIRPHDDLLARARELVGDAVGRGRSLCGQRAGQVARIYCPETLCSRFTAALLAALEQSEGVANPLPLIHRRAVADVQRQWSVGLDDGATLVFGGELLGPIQERRVLPTVFTNVEPRMACARRQAPMPILCLLRTGSQVP